MECDEAFRGGYEALSGGYEPLRGGVQTRAPEARREDGRVGACQMNNVVVRLLMVKLRAVTTSSPKTPSKKSCIQQKMMHRRFTITSMIQLSSKFLRKLLQRRFAITRMIEL